MDRQSLFVCYSHRDASRAAFKAFREILSLLNLAKEELEVVDDRQIPTGDKWHDWISKQLDRAYGAVLILSPNFLKSDYIRRVELPKILANQQARGLRIFHITLSDAPDTPQLQQILEYQSLHDPSKALDKYNSSSRNTVLKEVFGKIRTALDKKETGYHKSPDHKNLYFSNYDYFLTILPDGYVLSHRKLEVVTVEPSERLSHQFFAKLVDKKRKNFVLPPLKELAQNAKLHPIPFPREAFFCFPRRE